VKELMKRTFEMFAVDFFLQLGPDFKDYAEVFVKNGFNDVETICTMHIQEDLDTYEVKFSNFLLYVFLSPCYFRFMFFLSPTKCP
jgi:hypothetical protein